MKKATEALVIWEHKTGEADRVISLLTPEGVVSAYARGSLKPGGKLTSATAMLGYSDFELAEGRNMYTVAEASPILRFARLSANMADYALACCFCELVRLHAPSDSGAAKFLTLTLSALHLLSETDKPRALIKSVFEIKTLSEAGYSPDLSSCASCGGEAGEGCCFDSSGGNLLCKSCASRLGLPLNCPPGALSALRYIVEAPASRAFSFSLSESSLKALSALSEAYVRRWTEHPLPTLDFYRSIADGG
ncbi:MAG: DNA repair protein RecO [Oscillospiraceae bacterium]|nr:DNA repair protein RecO [Oscillospiraceae bacterium]